MDFIIIKINQLYINTLYYVGYILFELKIIKLLLYWNYSFKMLWTKYWQKVYLFSKFV